MGAESFQLGPHRFALARGGCGRLDVDDHRSRVVHDLARNTIATVISKIDSKATTEELPANQTILWAVPLVTADNNGSPDNHTIVKLDDGRTINVTEIHIERVPKQ